MLPFILIMALIASATAPGFIQPNVVYAAKESTAAPQGTLAASSIILGKGTIEIDGHLFTDEEFQTFLSNAKIYRVPFEQSSTFSLGGYGEIVGEDAQAAGALVILSNALIGVFDKIAEIMELATLEGSGYIVVGLIGLAAVRLAIQFLPDAIEINGVHINKFNSTLVGLTNFFSEHQNANPDEEIVDPDTIGSGGIIKPGEGTGDTTQPGGDTGDTAQPGEDTGETVQPGEDTGETEQPKITSDDIDWNINDNLKNHIANGSKGSHREPWKNFGINPDDPNFYLTVLPFLKQVVDEGRIQEESDVEGGTIIKYIKEFADRGYEIIVKIFIKSDGEKVLSDAYVYTR